MPYGILGKSIPVALEGRKNRRSGNSQERFHFGKESGFNVGVRLAPKSGCGFASRIGSQERKTFRRAPRKFAMDISAGRKGPLFDLRNDKTKAI